MRTLVLVVPGLGGAVLEQDLPALSRLAEIGNVVRIAPTPAGEMPEAAWLGAKPGEIHVEPGPLTISWIGARPPEWSLQFAVSTLSLQDGKLSPLGPTPESLQAEIARLGVRLNAKDLTFVPAARGWEHGLVLERRGDLETHAPEAAFGDDWETRLPRGDFDTILRRFIDDSVNLLMEQEFNQRRIDEGLPPINVLWPWGQGTVGRMPNLALRRGIPAQVAGDSVRLSGLANLVGDRIARDDFGTGLQTRFPLGKSFAERTPYGVLHLGAMLSFTEEQLEEKRWWVREFDARFLEPLLTSDSAEDQQLRLLSPMEGETGLAIAANLGSRAQNRVPFI